MWYEGGTPSCCSLPTPDTQCRSWSFVQCLCLASTHLLWPIVGSSQCHGETDGVWQECLLADSLGWGLVFLWKWCHPQQPTWYGMTRRLIHQLADPWCCHAALWWWFPWFMVESLAVWSQSWCCFLCEKLTRSTSQRWTTTVVISMPSTLRSFGFGSLDRVSARVIIFPWLGDTR